MLAWYSVIANAPSLARSPFLKLASARARASSTLVDETRRLLAVASSLKARVTIIMATERFPVYAHAGIAGAYIPGPTEMAQYEAGQKETAERVLAGVKRAAEKLGVQANTVHIPQAYPAEAIVEEAKALDCDLIVMASHGRRGLRKLVLGSQTSEVLASSPVPVLVVR